jgi:hypothetical protein
VGDKEAVPFQDGLDQTALRRVVVDDQDRFGHMKTPTELDARLFWTRPCCCLRLIQAKGKGAVSET